MDKCFVIQPFDKDKFDKRFNDVFEPAITKAGLKAYRIDKDPSVNILIDEIEKGIVDSAICFAEITTDNPNVWYELGYAFACGKDVVMVCSDEREASRFPFDIQHKHILTYQTSSPSDFTTLKTKITEKIIALQKKSSTIKTLNTTPILETEGLKSHEIALLILIMQNTTLNDDIISVYQLKHQMEKAGYTEIATSIGIRTLQKLGMIEITKAIDEMDNYQEYYVCRLTVNGEQWIFQNQNHLQFRQPKQNSTNTTQLPY